MRRLLAPLLDLLPLPLDLTALEFDTVLLTIQERLNRLTQEPGLLHHLGNGIVQSAGLLCPSQETINPLMVSDICPPFRSQEGDGVTVESDNLVDERIEALDRLR